MTDAPTHPSRVKELPLPPDAVERIAAFIAMIVRLGGHGTILIELRGDTVFVSGGERYVFRAGAIDSRQE